MSREIIVTIGISNAGKSTWTHNQWLADPHNTVVVNRDKIRELLFGYTEEGMTPYHVREDLNKLEKQVSKYEDTIIHEALAEGKRVIVDATHLSPKYIERFKYWNVPTSVEWFDITLKEALTRNMSRTRKVPEPIMHKQYAQYVELRKSYTFEFSPETIVLDESLPACYLLDIDGTIAHHNNKRNPFDWKRVGVDDVCPALLPTINAISNFGAPGESSIVKMIVVSGRDSVCRPETEEWLQRHGVRYDELHMRTENDNRPDWQIKQEIWTELAKKYNILAGFDDRMQVVRRGRALGLKMFQVEYNNF